MAETPSDTPTFAAETAATGSTPDADASPSAEPELRGDERYHDLGPLGRGGMGEVRRCDDLLIGRDVAFKTMRAVGSPEGRLRFLHEARLQARLEHPSIVPVYDMGTDADGNPWFTMRRIDGRTLDRVIAALAEAEPGAAEHYGRRRLLGDFVRVCQAVAHAHRRGVVHRDIKPSNIILTDDGGVYLLDWGIAKRLGHDDAATVPLTSSQAIAEPLTDAASMLGTLGYMPPEQLDRGAVDGRADVYALGATLFELLTLQPLHPRASPPELVASTLEGADACAQERAPEAEVPCELEAVCRRATATLPDDRYPDVPSMITAIEAYLDGDRDLQQRRALAREHAARAERGLTPGADLAARAAAMREAGRALALDPESTAALRVITQLMLEPPANAPPEVEREISRTDTHNARALAGLGVAARIANLAMVGVLLWMGVRSWPLLTLFAGLTVVSAFYALRGSKRSTNRGVPLRVQLGNALLLGALATAVGPFVVVPGLAITAAAMFALAGSRDLRVVLTLGAAPVVVPFVLEQLAIVPATTVAVGDALVIHPWMVSFPAVPTYVLLLLGTLTSLVVAVLSMANVRHRLTEARREQLLQAWHLRQLLRPAEG